MACGEAALPIYELLDELGGEDCLSANNLLFENLVRWLDGNGLDEFVENFRRQYDMPLKEETDSEEEAMGRLQQSDSSAGQHTGG